jgi:hypothetical protein
VDPRAGLDDVEKRNFLTLPGLELRPLGRPARSQSLYRLRHPGSRFYHVICLIMLVNTFHLISYVSHCPFRILCSARILLFVFHVLTMSHIMSCGRIVSCN